MRTVPSLVNYVVFEDVFVVEPTTQLNPLRKPAVCHMHVEVFEGTHDNGTAIESSRKPGQDVQWRTYRPNLEK